MAAIRKRIAMVGYTFYASDPRVQRHVVNLTGAGYDVDVIALSNPNAARERDEEHVKFYLPRNRSYECPNKLLIIMEYVLFTFLAGLILLGNHIRGRRYSLVHINNMPNFLLFAALPLRMLGVPVLLDIHDTMPEIYQAKFGFPPEHWMIRLLFFEERLCMRLADFVMTTEHTKWQRLVENGLRKEKSVVTLNLPDSSIFPEPELPQKPAAQNNTFRLVYHGTLAVRLGVDVAIQAVGELRDKIPGICFDIIGDGEQRAELIALVEDLQLGDHVHFSDGFVPTDKLPEILDGSDLAVVPSRKNIGTRLMLPTKLLEYARLGIPGITVPTHTIKHYFKEPMVRYVPSEDPSALADKILYLYNHPEERLATAKAARGFYNEYNFETERERYLETVHNLTNRTNNSV